MTNNIYFIANWKMYGSISSLNSLNKLIKLTNLKKFNKAKIIYFPPLRLYKILLKNLKIQIYLWEDKTVIMLKIMDHSLFISSKMLKDLDVNT